MIRFYKTISKIVRTLKSYLTGAVLKIVLFSYNVLTLCYLACRRFVSFRKNKTPKAVGRRVGLSIDLKMYLMKKMYDKNEFSLEGRADFESIYQEYLASLPPFHMIRIRQRGFLDYSIPQLVSFRGGRLFHS